MKFPLWKYGLLGGLPGFGIFSGFGSRFGSSKLICKFPYRDGDDEDQKSNAKRCDPGPDFVVASIWFVEFYVLHLVPYATPERNIAE